MDRNYHAIVIGAGLGGLTAAACLARAGRRVLILERNHEIGGAATTYRRGELTIEASLHATDGLDALDPKLRVLRELGVLERVEFVPTPEFYEVRGGPVGEPLLVPHGLAQAREALIARFPNQQRGLARYFDSLGAIRTALHALAEPRTNGWSLRRALRLPAALWPVVRDRHSTLSDVLHRLFGDEEAVKIALAANLAYYSDSPDDLWWLLFALAQGSFLDGGGHFVRGGSQRLSAALGACTTEAGGLIRTGREAVRILLDVEGRVAGVAHRARDGGAASEEISDATIVLGNAAPHVLQGMLPEDSRTAFMGPFEQRPLSLSLFTAALGLSHPPAQFGVRHYTTIVIPDWLQRLSELRDGGRLTAGDPNRRLPVYELVDYSRIDAGLSEGSPYLATLTFVDSAANWSGLDPRAYESRRARWTDALLADLDRHFPGIRAAVLQSETSTALSLQRRLNTPQGAVYGFAPRPPARLPRGAAQEVRTAVPGLWLASAFAGFGGVTGAVCAGDAAARAALEDDTKAASPA